ncbi:MAG: TrkH family potassium uptake protein [Deltaproteobacteria bacterium]|nr:TrkH family potassium uptake protein [Deltaproteobacteria bacterium]
MRSDLRAVESALEEERRDLRLARAHVLSALVLLLVLFMVPSALYSLLDAHHTDRRGLLAALALCVSGGGAVFWRTRGALQRVEFNHLDGLLLVTATWLTAGVVCALPYYLYAHLSPTAPCGAPAPVVGAEFCSFTNAFFESMSGLTTTGASIITDGLWDRYEGGVGYAPSGALGLPRGIMLWRCATHLIGGLGIIVLGVAVLPLLGVGGMQLFKAEAPGPKTDKLAPRMKETAKILWRVYGALTAGLALIFWGSGSMDFFESVCHAMSTMGTGGFSTRATSVAGFASPLVEWVMVVFMFLAGASFNLHFFFIQGHLRAYWESVEMRAYALLVLLGGGLVSYAVLAGGYAVGVEEALRVGLFQVISIVTTTGYASANFELWTGAPLALMVLTLFMFLGGCAGSTAGGVKVVRHLLLWKVWTREFFYLLNPTGKRSIRSEGQVVSPDVLRASIAFVGLYLTLFVAGSLFFALCGHDLATALTCSASSLGNIGPGLGDIGPYDNYAGLTASGKWVSALLMLLGRLELYTVLVVFTPAFWRR